jgi:hypothetical protein
MSGRPPRSRLRRAAGSFAGCLRQFLTPALLKQARAAAGPRRRCRWELQPLLVVLLSLTWCTGDSQPERFETARAFYAALHPKRRRPGRTVQGFHQALCRLPCAVLRLLAAASRARLLAWGALLRHGGWLVLGCDGTALACPRTAELEQRLASAGGRPGPIASPPQLALTALVHLASGVLWSWRLGKGAVNERDPLRALLPSLPARALVVADAGYQGYALACDLAAASVAFLIRVTSLSTLYPAEAGAAPAGGWEDGPAWYWPAEAQKQGLAPLRVRLLRVRTPGRKHDVWLVSNVLEPGRLSAAQAGRFYRLRWGSEGFFRCYKRTLGKVKLCGRAVR